MIAAAPLFILLGLILCVGQFVAGVGATLLLRPRLPRACYFIGFLVPLLFPVLLWFAYLQYSAAQPCLPENRLGCGEADAYTFLLLGGVFLFDVGVSAVIQYVMSYMERRRKGLLDQEWKKRDL